MYIFLISEQNSLLFWTLIWLLYNWLYLISGHFITGFYCTPFRVSGWEMCPKVELSSRRDRERDILALISHLHSENLNLQTSPLPERGRAGAARWEWRKMCNFFSSQLSEWGREHQAKFPWKRQHEERRQHERERYCRTLPDGRNRVQE